MTPAAAFATSSCAPGACSMLSRSPRRTPLETDELIDHFLVVEDDAPLERDRRYVVSIDVRFRRFGDLVLDAQLAKLLARQLTGIAISLDSLNAIPFQVLDEVADDLLRRGRRSRILRSTPLNAGGSKPPAKSAPATGSQAPLDSRSGWP